MSTTRFYLQSHYYKVSTLASSYQIIDQWSHDHMKVYGIVMFIEITEGRKLMAFLQNLMLIHVFRN